MAKTKAVKIAKKTTKKVSKKSTISKSIDKPVSVPKMTKKVATKKAPQKRSEPKSEKVSSRVTHLLSKRQEGSLTAANSIQMYQIDTLRELASKKKKGQIVNSSPTFFEAVMKTLFASGFELSEADPVLTEHKLDDLPYGNFYIRLSHKNLDKLSGDDYTINLFLMITSDHNRIVVAKYCVHFPITQTTILMPANLRGDWNFNWNQKKKDWYLVTQPKITSFLDKLPILVSFIERMKARKITAKEADAVKKDITTEFMNPSRINGRKLLWEKSDGKEFHHKPIYAKENNLFEAVANIVALFTARSGQKIRRSTSERTKKEYLYYAYCTPEVWEKKNGELAEGDIEQGKMAVPITFSRRTYFTFSNVTENVSKYLDESVKKVSAFEA